MGLISKKETRVAKGTSEPSGHHQSQAIPQANGPILSPAKSKEHASRGVFVRWLAPMVSTQRGTGDEQTVRSSSWPSRGLSPRFIGRRGNVATRHVVEPTWDEMMHAPIARSI